MRNVSNVIVQQTKLVACSMGGCINGNGNSVIIRKRSYYNRKYHHFPLMCLTRLALFVGSIEITRSCFLSPKTFNKLTSDRPKGMTAEQAEGSVFSPASRANANVLRELLGVE